MKTTRKPRNVIDDGTESSRSARFMIKSTYIVNSEPVIQTLDTHAITHVRTRACPFFREQMKKTGNEMCFELVTLP